MKRAWKILLILVMVSTLPGCCFDRCRPNLRLFGQPAAQVVQPPANWCVGNCSVDKDVYETPAYVTP
jgi:hypothetical protein